MSKLDELKREISEKEKEQLKEKKIKENHQEVVNNLKAVSEGIRGLRDKELPKFPEYPKEIKVSNLEDIVIPEVKIPETIIPEYPKEIEVKEPKWFSIKGIIDALVDLKRTILKQPTPDLDRFTKKANAIAVKLVLEDGTKFYNAGSGGSSGSGFGNQNSVNLEALRTNTNEIINLMGSNFTNEYNIVMTLVNTEYSLALPVDTKQFQFQCRGNYDVRYAFTTGKVATSVSPYFTLKAGMSIHEDKLNLTGITVYFACGTAGQVVELLVWN